MHYFNPSVFILNSFTSFRTGFISFFYSRISIWVNSRLKAGSRIEASSCIDDILHSSTDNIHGALKGLELRFKYLFSSPGCLAGFFNIFTDFPFRNPGVLLTDLVFDKRLPGTCNFWIQYIVQTGVVLLKSHKKKTIVLIATKNS